MKEIHLTQGFIAVVDDADYAGLSAFSWHCFTSRVSPMVYAARSLAQGGTEFLHHMLLPKKPGFLVDHINLDSLNDQRINLRYVTRTGNSANRAKQRGRTTSQYKGVSWLKCGKAWMAYIKHKGRRRYLGLFDDESEAARAYDIAAVRLFGEFARPNFL